MAAHHKTLKPKNTPRVARLVVKNLGEHSRM